MTTEQQPKDKKPGLDLNLSRAVMTDARQRSCFTCEVQLNANGLTQGGILLVCELLYKCILKDVHKRHEERTIQIEKNANMKKKREETELQRGEVTYLCLGFHRKHN